MKTAKPQGEDVTETLNPRPCSETSEPIFVSWDCGGDTTVVKEYWKQKK